MCSGIVLSDDDPYSVTNLKTRGLDGSGDWEWHIALFSSRLLFRIQPRLEVFESSFFLRAVQCDVSGPSFGLLVVSEERPKI